jgi:chemotaxis protein histidine kinase CheA
MATAMLRLPLTSVLLAALLVGVGNSLKVVPLVIVAVVVSHVLTAWLTRDANAA